MTTRGREPYREARRRRARRRAALRRALRDAATAPSSRALLAARDGRPARDVDCATAGACRSIVDLAPAAGWDEREAARPLRRRASPATSRCGRSSTTTSTLAQLDGPGTRPRRLPGRGRTDPRRRHRVRALPLPRRRRAHPPPRRAPLLQAPRPRTRRRGHARSTTALAYVAARLRRLRRHERRRLRARRARRRSACADRELARARTILLELERLWNHLNDIAASAPASASPPATTASPRSPSARAGSTRALTGHRFLFGTVRVGGSALDARRERRPRTRATSSRRSATTRAAAWRELALQRLLPGPPRRTSASSRPTTPARSAPSGPPHAPPASPTTPAHDSPRLAYDGFEPVAPTAPTGDVAGAARAARARAPAVARASSTRSSTGRVAPGARRRRATAPAEIGVGRVESPRGATICVVERDGDRIARLHLRTGSYANWPVVAHAAAGNLLPDFPLINKSFELCYACADR